MRDFFILNIFNIAYLRQTMYSVTQLAKKFASYWLHASNGKGHGIHSPFVYDFVRNVLMDKQIYPCYKNIESIRKKLKRNSDLLTIQDFGAGSRVNSERKRSVESIANAALKPKKYAQLLFRIAHYYQPKELLELGTSLGVTSSYLATANPNSVLHTFEGAPAVANVAAANFKNLKIQNIEQVLGNFDNTLPTFLQSHFANAQKLDFAFIDGNHREEPTVAYFHQLLPYVHEHSILIFDDIHWSEGMENAWNQISADPNVTLTIDLFFIGLVFFRKENKEKEHFTIRY